MNISKKIKLTSIVKFQGIERISNMITRIFTDSYNGWAIIDKPDVGNNLSHYKYGGD